MIKTFAPKGLKAFFFSGSLKGIQPQHKQKLRLQLALLDAAIEVSDMNKPGWHFHQLTGNKAKVYAVKVSSNWRMTFKFKDGYAYIVNYEDYH